jgi:hypothetical protein
MPCLPLTLYSPILFASVVHSGCPVKLRNKTNNRKAPPVREGLNLCYALCCAAYMRLNRAYTV